MKRIHLLFAAAVMLALPVLAQTAWIGEAVAQEKTKIVFASGRPDDAWYALSYGLATKINERSDKLEAEVITTAGVADATRLAQRSPDKRANHVVISQTPGMEMWATEEYTTKKIGSCLHLASAWVTLNPELKTLADLKGKSVALSRKGPGFYVWIFADLLKQAGAWDTANPCTAARPRP